MSFQEGNLVSVPDFLRGKWKLDVFIKWKYGECPGFPPSDFKRFFDSKHKQAKLLFVAHRQEILQQAQATFANVLRDQNFGELSRRQCGAA